MTFLILDLPGVWFALLAFTITEPLRRKLLLGAGSTPVRTSFKEAFTQMGLRWQSVIGIPVGVIFRSTCNYAVSSWVLVYLPRIHGWTATQSGKTLALIIIERMLGTSLALRIGRASILMFVVFLMTVRPFRIHFQMVGK
jgi:hypothetical protein